MNAVRVREILERAGIRFALIGAAAVSLRGHPRFTQDTDFFTTDSRVLDLATWEKLTGQGVAVETRKGDFDDPLGGVVRIGTMPDQVEVVVGKWKWEAEILSRSEPLEAFGGSILVPTRSDLILLKLAAGGFKDLVDAAALLSLGPRNDILAEVGSHIAELPPLRSGRVAEARRDRAIAFFATSNSRPLPGDAVKTDPDAPHATNAEWSADFRAAEDHALDASLAATPSQRLAWLEETLAFALRVGALPRPSEEIAQRNGVPLMPQRPNGSERPTMDVVNQPPTRRELANPRHPERGGLAWV